MTARAALLALVAGAIVGAAYLVGFAAGYAAQPRGPVGVNVTNQMLKGK